MTREAAPKARGVQGQREKGHSLVKGDICERDITKRQGPELQLGACRSPSRFPAAEDAKSFCPLRSAVAWPPLLLGAGRSPS